MQVQIRVILTVTYIFAALSACTEAVSWQKLLSAKIKTQYPSYVVQTAPDGALKVLRPSLPDIRVNVDEIAQLCQRGPNDCNYATDQMLISLQKN